MSRLQEAIVIGATGGAMLTVFAKAIWPAPESLFSLRRRMFGDPLATADRTRERSTLQRRVGSALARTQVGAWFATRFGPDLRTAGQTVPEVFAEMVVYVVLAVAFTIAIGMAVVAAGVGLSFIPITGLAICAGGLAVALGLHGLTERASRRRQEWRHGTAAYIQLVSSCMAVHSAEASILKAADVGRGPVFEVIANAIRSAPAMGRTRWEALETVGRDYGVMELRDLASAIERSSSLGASTRDSVSAIATSMRSRTLDEAERAADRNSNQMFGPTYLFVVGFVVFLAWPIMQRISNPVIPIP
jgi:Flp pilus assembly protein TadB